ncbi:MAG: ABC transporter permease [Opitutaceae bacterium]|jgi:spermidine/putrescine transport system permease protein|nr:ABC transporter permease [Opitutaceae bacterium]
MQALPSVNLENPHARRARAGAWLLIAPLVIWLGLFVVAPLGILVAYSLASTGELGQVEFALNFDNYVRVFDPIYLKIFGRSIAYAALTTVLCLVIGYPVAWYIARQRPVVRNRLLLLVMIPFWTSFLIRTYAWIAILRSEGLLNATLSASGAIPAIFPEPLALLYTPTAVVIGLVYAYLPFMILPIYGSAEKLDHALVEAAHDLGAGPLRVFREVIIPLTRPGIAAGMLLVFVPAIGMFAITDLMGGARVSMIGNVIHNQFTKALNYPFGAALGVVFTLLFVLSYALLQWRGRRRDRG